MKKLLVLMMSASGLLTCGLAQAQVTKEVAASAVAAHQACIDGLRKLSANHNDANLHPDARAHLLTGKSANGQTHPHTAAMVDAMTPVAKSCSTAKDAMKFIDSSIESGKPVADAAKPELEKLGSLMQAHQAAMAEAMKHETLRHNLGKIIGH